MRLYAVTIDGYSVGVYATKGKALAAIRKWHKQAAKKHPDFYNGPLAARALSGIIVRGPFEVGADIDY